MEFKRCERCGSFFITNTRTCAGCLNKENLDVSKLRDYFEINGEVNSSSLENLSYETGIPERNLNRQLSRINGSFDDTFEVEVDNRYYN